MPQRETERKKHLDGKKKARHNEKKNKYKKYPNLIILTNKLIRSETNTNKNPLQLIIFARKKEGEERAKRNKTER